MYIYISVLYITRTIMWTDLQIFFMRTSFGPLKLFQGLLNHAYGVQVSRTF